MASTSKKTRTPMLTQVNGYVAGLKASPPANAKNINVLTQVFTVPTLITALVAIQTILQTAATARTSYVTANANAKSETKAQRAFVTAVKKALIYLYGTDIDGLKGCGIEPPKAPTPQSTATRAIAYAKSTATRAANGTGKKPAKASPTVTVTDASGQVIGAPAAAPAAPTNAAAPAPGNAPPAAAGH